MFVWLIIIAVIAGFLYHRWHGPVMHEAARSYIFLEALRDGATNGEASDRASLDPEDVTLEMSHNARVHRQRLYSKPVFGSKIWPQIGEAYRRGLLPVWLPDTLWQTVYDWARKGDYPFPPVLRASFISREETAYEAYYSRVMSILARQTGLDLEHVSYLIRNVDDEGSRNAYNNEFTPEEWAATLHDLYLREGAPLTKEVM